MQGIYGKDQPKDKVNRVKYPKKSKADNSRITSRKDRGYRE